MSEHPPPARQPATRPLRRRGWRRLLRAAVAHRRSDAADVVLGVVLTFVAGAVNAGGFLAIGQYTSHMTGIVAAMADHLVVGTLGVVGAGIVSLVSFVAGAGCSAMLINWGRRNTPKRQYAYPLVLEAMLLLGFGILGVATDVPPGALAFTLPLLCFIMGLQNATITKISGARIRTTHVTGMVTDIGIELGKLLYFNRGPESAARRRVVADRKKLSILGIMVAMFFLGGLVGALGFSHFGLVFCMPLAALLFILAYPQVR